MEEERKDLGNYMLQQKVKKLYKDWFVWREKVSLSLVRKMPKQLKIRKGQLEVHYGEVLQRIEEADLKELRRILNSRRVVKSIYKTLTIEPYKFNRKVLQKSEI